MAANTKRYVLDASFVLSFLMPDELRPEVEELFGQFREGAIEFVSNLLLPFEVANGLKSSVITKRITPDYALERVEEFLDYQIELKEVNFTKVLLLAQKSDLSCYDASYLYLAKELKLPLLSLDSHLKQLV